MKGGNRAKGFTIVETLIVLAVSGFMLVAVVGIISNKQGQSEFQQAVNSVAQQLQQAIDDVANGYYPTSNIACTATSSGPAIKSGRSSLGTNGDCVLVGKAVQFDATNTQFIDYPLVDLQTGGGYYTAIAPGSSSNTLVPDNSSKIKVNGGLTIYYSGPSNLITSPLPTLGFSLILSNQAVNLYYIAGTSAGNSSAINVDAIDRPSSNLKPITINSYNICLASGTTKQSGLISIGGNSGKNLSVTLAIKDGTQC